MSETLWRCTRCGKWSHARRRPKTHERWISAASGRPDEHDVIVRTEAATYDHLNGFTSDGGWYVECGPFEQWTAVRGEVVHWLTRGDT